MNAILKKRDSLFDCEDDYEHVIVFLEYQLWKAQHAGLYN